MDLSARRQPSRPPFGRLAVATVCAAILAISSSALAVGERPVFEDPGIIQAVEGESCSGSTGKGNVLLFEGSHDFPSYVDQATVIFNGWRLVYRSDDKQVLAVRFAPSDVGLVGSRLSWHGVATLRDYTHDNEFTLCYFYVAVGWSTRWIDATVVSNPPPAPGGTANQSGSIESRTDPFPASATGGRRPFALPLGTDLEFYDVGSLFGASRDHELFQIGYDQSQPYLAGPNVIPGSRMLMKDDETRELQIPFFKEYFVVGSGVEALVPAWGGLKERKVCNTGLSGGCIGDQVSDHRGVWTVPVERNVSRYDYALPMLTGVDLSYADGPHEVRGLGAWIQGVTLDRVSKSLRYSVSTTLADNDGSPGFVARTGETLLGFTRRVRPRSRVRSTRSVFYNVVQPKIGGYRVDFCESWGQGCGQPAADRFCRDQHGPKSSAFDFSIEENVGKKTPTMTQGDHLVCSDSYCDAFGYVTCEVPIHDRYVYQPKRRGDRVDFCASYAKDCGQPAADLFCRKKFGKNATAVHYSIDENIGARTPTRTLEDDAVCKASFCDGFKSITCREIRGS